MMLMRYKKFTIFYVLLLAIHLQLKAEDGSQLWLRFNHVTTDWNFSAITGNANSVAVSEFQRAWKMIKGSELKNLEMLQNDALLIGTLRDKQIKGLKMDRQLQALGVDGYVIKTLKIKEKELTVVASVSEKGLLYGVFHLLRLIQTHEINNQLNISEKPSYAVRVLNHWDNLDGSVERGYSGHSIWKWDELPAVVSPRYVEYARANASVGINGSVLNNVNAAPEMLSPEMIAKVKVIADVLRKYYIKVYLAVNFSSPKEIGGLPTSDPLDPAVRKWWKNKAAEIYRQIPDFGGFLVKANSEGLPGPMDYGRTHVDGANMLAEAVKPYGGIIMWRAFVYEPGDDRAKLAYKEFVKFDGQFADNVLIQVKNGPIDFQPREPFSPLFGGMKKTKLMPEFQITQEYTGQGNHLAFLSTMWEECLKSDTYCQGEGSTVARVTDGRLFHNQLTAIAGVANIGEDANWTGQDFGQANWYAFGRLAWNDELRSEVIANEWIKQTFTADTAFVQPIQHMMMESREAVVDYMMPLGLHHLFAWEHHYGPEPWCEIPGARPDWLPKYYHKADSVGLGFDRTSKGSDAVSQYHSPLKEELDDMQKCPENLLLWFHHVPWDYKMKDGKTLWDELCYKYDEGVQQVREFQKIWDENERFVDTERFHAVQSKLRTQSRDAVWWKDACLLYFQTFSKRPIPYDIERPVHDLDSLKAIKLHMKNHN